MAGHPVAVVGAVDDEAAGGDRPQPDQAFLDPVARRHRLHHHAARQLLAGGERHQRAQPARSGREWKWTSTCQWPSGRSNAPQAVSAGSRLSTSRLAIFRAAVSSAVRCARKLAPGPPAIFWALLTGVYAQGGETFHRKYQQDIQAYPPHDGSLRAAFPKAYPLSPQRGQAWTATKPPAPNWCRPGVRPRPGPLGRSCWRSSIPAARSRCPGSAGPTRSSSPTASAISAAAARPSTCCGRPALRSTARAPPPRPTWRSWCARPSRAWRSI